MKNKVELKKTIIKTVIISVVLIILFSIINALEYKSYQKNYNIKVNAIISEIKQKLPEITENEIADIVNAENSSKNNLRDYGYDINNEAIIIQNNKLITKYIIIELLIIIIMVILLNAEYLRYNSKKNKDINDITKLITQINNRKYELKIDEYNEDELSILKSEIYKTTLLLREETDNSVKDKLELKKSLEDISHQLKTPLTAIMINLDNIIDNQNIGEKERKALLRKIKRQTYNLKFLIECILKLSKFDVNTVEYNDKEVYIKDIINSAIENVSALADLKNVEIKVYGNVQEKIYCDSKWQIEAISNILKNAIEHSNEGSEVCVLFENNKIYTKIDIKNMGDTISKKDLKHLFERFYKGENATENSVGIGLALSKVIIEKDNGNIDVVSEKGQTDFVIRYYKNN